MLFYVVLFWTHFKGYLFSLHKMGFCVVLFCCCMHQILLSTFNNWEGKSMVDLAIIFICSVHWDEHTTEPKVGKNWICNLVSSSRQPLTLQLQAVNRYLFKTSGHRFSWCTMNEKYCKEKKDHIRYIQQHWQRNTIFIYIYLMALILSILCIMFLKSIIVVKLSIWNHLTVQEQKD